MCLSAYWQRNIVNHLARIYTVTVKPDKQTALKHQMVQTKNNKLAFAEKEKEKPLHIWIHTPKFWRQASDNPYPSSI